MTDDEEFERGYGLAGEAIDYYRETGDGRPVEMICHLLEQMTKGDSMLPLHFGMAAALEAKQAAAN